MLPLALVALSLPRVTFSQLASDGWYLNTLCEYPDPPYTTKQASSYDRSSKAPGNEAWFANQDWGNFVREEQVNGRKERVLVDAAGPGVMVRFWTPNPAGVTRIYIDGAATPTIEAKTADLLSGKVKPYVSPLAEVTARGWTLYCPVAFQKSLKVTVDDSDKDAAKAMYYQVQYRDYADGVTVEPFAEGLVEREGLVRKMKRPKGTPNTAALSSRSTAIASGETSTIEIKRAPMVVRSLRVELPKEPRGTKWDDPVAWHNLLRTLQVTADFDGQRCIDAPLGDLMATPVGVSPTESLPVSISEDGKLSLNLPMPFRSSATFSIKNNGPKTVWVKFTVGADEYVWTDRSMHFKAQWLCYNGPTRPMVDIPYLHAQGTGVFVGCNAGISNPVGAWWGEGDEKIFVDDETFPSTFGTGTEDYFGYGWCDPALFAHPYHFQSRCDGPGNKGHTNVGRWQILDRMPFEKSFRFDMELWHWADCQIIYGRTAYWYAKPGGSAPKSDLGADFLPPFIEGVTRVVGAVEGEEAKILSSSGGVSEVQSFGELSNGRQLWWRNAEVGSRLVLRPTLPNPGRYRVYARCCFARDYGVHTIKIGGIEQTLDFFGDLTWKTVDLGVTDIKGHETLSVEIQRPNPKAVPGNMFGLDYLVFVKEQT